MYEFGWIVATVSLLGNIYLGWLLWKSAVLTAALNDLRDVIQDATDGKDNGSTFTRLYEVPHGENTGTESGS